MNEICWNSDSLPLSSVHNNLSLILSLKRLNTSFTSFHIIFQLNWGFNWTKWWRMIEPKFYIFWQSRWIFVYNQYLEYIGGSFFHSEIVTHLSTVTRRVYPATIIWNDEQSRLRKLSITATCSLFSIHLWTSIKFLYIPEFKSPPKYLGPQNSFVSKIVKAIMFNLLSTDLHDSLMYVRVFSWFQWIQTLSVIYFSKRNVWKLSVSYNTRYEFHQKEKRKM